MRTSHREARCQRDIAGDTILVGSPCATTSTASAGGAYVFGSTAGHGPSRPAWWIHHRRLRLLRLRGRTRRRLAGRRRRDSRPQRRCRLRLRSGRIRMVRGRAAAAPGAEAWQKFGSSVSIDGNRAVIGAYGYPDSAGHGYIYESTAGGWVESVKLVAKRHRRSTRRLRRGGLRQPGLLGCLAPTDTSLGLPVRPRAFDAAGRSNRDGQVNVLDILDVLASWGSCPTRPCMETSIGNDDRHRRPARCRERSPTTRPSPTREEGIISPTPGRSATTRADMARKTRHLRPAAAPSAARHGGNTARFGSTRPTSTPPNSRRALPGEAEQLASSSATILPAFNTDEGPRLGLPISLSPWICSTTGHGR